MERPTGFAEPAQAVSLSAPAVLTAPADESVSVVPPSDFQQASVAVPLDTLVPVQADPRDPQQPFVTVSSTLTATEASGVTGPGTGRQGPQEPFQVVSTISPMAPSWAPPPPDAQPARAVHPVTARDALTAAYPPLLITLVVSGVVSTFAAVLAVMVLVATPFLFAPRVRFRNRALKISSFLVLGLLALLWVISLFLGSTMYNVDLSLGTWVMVGCWVLAAVDIFLQWLGLRNGEQPTGIA